MKHFLLSLITAVALAAACGESSPEGAGPGTAAQAEERVPVAIVDSIGVELGDSNYVFGSIAAIAFGPDGNIYVLDRGTCNVRVYSPEGEHIRTISRQGSGPGEMTSPFAMAVLGDGRITVCAPFQGGMQSFFPDGSWEGLTAEFTNNPPMGMVGADSNAYVALRLQVDFVDDALTTSYHVGRYVEASEPSIIYYENEFPFDPEDLTSLLMNTFYNRVYTADREGNVYMAPYSTEEYSVQMMDREGNVLLELVRDMPMVEKSPEEILEEKTWMEAWLQSLGAGGVVIDFEPETYRWQISALGYDSQGRIWVRRGTELTPVFDVFDGASGELLFTAEVEGAGSDAQFWEFSISDQGMIAYSQNPELYQKVYIMELPE
jgi:hypothetical protein